MAMLNCDRDDQGNPIFSEILDVPVSEFNIFMKILSMLGDDTKLHLGKGLRVVEDNKTNEFKNIMNLKPCVYKTRDMW